MIPTIQPTHKTLLLALLLGAAPAVAAWLWLPGAIQGGDLMFAAGALPLALLLPQFFKPFPMRRQIPSWLPWVILLVFSGLGQLRMPGPISNDEHAYLAQANLFASGQLCEEVIGPGCPDNIAHCPTHQRQMMERTNPDGSLSRYAKYPPGTSLALTPFAAIGIPSIMVLLMGLLDLWLMLKVARRFGLATPEWAPLLLAATPFFLLVHTSFQSEVFTLPAALLGYLSVLRLRDNAGCPNANSAIIAASAGWIFLCRPLTGVVFAIACAPILLRRWRLLVKHGIPTGLIFLAVFLGWNKLQTGDWLTTTYHVYAEKFGPWFADGEMKDVYGNGDALLGWWRQFARFGVSTFATIGASALGFWGLWRARKRDGGTAFIFSGLLCVAYAFHWYPGHWAYLGPLYDFESIGFLTIGVFVILDQAPDAWRRGLPLAAAIAGIIFFMHRFKGIEEESVKRSAPQTLAAASEDIPRDALILLPYVPQEGLDPGKSFATTRPPFEDHQQVFMRMLPGERQTRQVIKEMGLGQRPLYLFVPGGTREFDSLREL